MVESLIPHAVETFVEVSPPMKILHVRTALVEHFGTPEFDAAANHDLLQAIGSLIGPRNEFDSYVIHWAHPQCST